MKQITLLVLSLLLLSCTSCIRPQAILLHDSRTELWQQIAAVSVRIDTICSDGNEYYGSGTVIGQRQVLTAKHVAEDEKDVLCIRKAIDFSGKERLFNMSPKLHESKDMAILTLATEEENFSSIAQKAVISPVFGQKFYDVGGDGTFSPKFIPLELTWAGEAEDREWYLTGPGKPGFSGSGIFDENGRLVGVLYAGRWHPTLSNIVIVIPIKEASSLS